MRSLTRWGGLLLLAALVVGCDSNQPLQLGDQTLEIRIQAINALAFVYDVWDMIEDNDGDGEPDDGRVYLWCERQFGVTRNPKTVPWSFSLQISVVRKGETEPERRCTVDGSLCQDDDQCGLSGFDLCEGAVPSEQILGVCSISAGPCLDFADCVEDDFCELATGTVAAEESFNIALYDDVTVTFTGTAKDDVIVAGRTFKFDRTTARTHPAAHFDVMQSTDNPLVELQPPITTLPGQGPQTYLGNGLCSRGHPGLPTMGSQLQPYTLTLNKGDTVTITARMSDTAPFPLANEAFDSVLFLPPSAISIELRADGRIVNTSGQESGRSISVSYTAR